MKKLLKALIGICLPALVAVAETGTRQTPAQTSQVTLEVLNPRGDIAPPPFLAPRARVTDLSGKKIGIYWISKPGGNNFWDVIEELLKAKYPTAKILRYKGPFDLGEKMAANVAREVDTFLYGVGD